MSSISRAYKACTLCHEYANISHVNPGGLVQQPTTEGVWKMLRDQANFEAMRALEGSDAQNLLLQCVECDYKSPRIANGLEKQRVKG